MVVGRPRKIRSKPTSGVGGREFDASEILGLLRLGEKYSLDLDDEQSCVDFIESLWAAHGSYCATEDALLHQAGVADELFDLETLLARARIVLSLVERGAELSDDIGCLSAAHNLTQALHAFPNLLAAQTTAMVERTEFLDAKRTIECSILRVRLWTDCRNQFVASLKLLIDVCERVEAPKIFTKRTRQARDMFESDLGRIYLERLHPEREAIWRETRREANDPPPPRSMDEFAYNVMALLRVKFEVKKVSG